MKASTGMWDASGKPAEHHWSCSMHLAHVLPLVPPLLLQLGRGDAKGAQRTAQTATACVLASQALIGVAAYTYREPLLGLMTNNTEVIKLAMEVGFGGACLWVALCA